MRTAHYSINGREITYDIHGETHFGDNVILLNGADDLSKGAPWHLEGYCVKEFLDEDRMHFIRVGIQSEIKRRLEVATGRLIKDFSLERYHYFCAEPSVHFSVVNSLKFCLPIETFPIDWRLLDVRISEICGVSVTAKHAEKIASSRFCLRIVRPNATMDNNPPHRDVWIDRLRDAINIYVPLAGNDENSSLSLIPRSHFWTEQEVERTKQGAVINGIAYTVPCAVSAKKGLHLIRPQVHPNQVLVFSPYLIHGGAVNLNPDTTRVSLEIRFWRK